MSLAKKGGGMEAGDHRDGSSARHLPPPAWCARYVFNESGPSIQSSPGRENIGAGATT